MASYTLSKLSGGTIAATSATACVLWYPVTQQQVVYLLAQVAQRQSVPPPQDWSSAHYAGGGVFTFSAGPSGSLVAGSTLPPVTVAQAAIGGVVLVDDGTGTGTWVRATVSANASQVFVGGVALATSARATRLADSAQVGPYGFTGGPFQLGPVAEDNSQWFLSGGAPSVRGTALVTVATLGAGSGALVETTPNTFTWTPSL